MKIIIRLFFALLFLILVAAGAIQTPFVKNQIKKIVVASLETQGLVLSIDHLDGDLPFEWTLKGVSLSYKERTVTMGSMKARFAILPLIKKRVEITYLKITEGDFEGLPFEGTASGRIDLARENPIKITNLLIEGKELFIRFAGKVHPDLSIQEGNITFNLPNLAYFERSIKKGALRGTGEVTKDKVHFSCEASNLQFEMGPASDLNITIDAARKGTKWDGKAAFSTSIASIPFGGEGTFHVTPLDGAISLGHFDISGPDVRLFGKLDFDQTLHRFAGVVSAECLDLRSLRPLFPNSYLKGSLGAKLELQSFSNQQDLKCQVSLEDVTFYDATCPKLTLETSLYDLFGALRGDFALVGQKMVIDTLELSQVELKSTFDAENAPFEILMTGQWQDPFELKSQGVWERGEKGVCLSVNSFTGFALKESITLLEPLVIDWGLDHFKMSPFSFAIAKGSLTAHIDLTKNSSVIKANGVDFPLPFIPFPKKHFSLAGVSSFDIDIVAWEKNIQGHCDIALKRALLFSEGSPKTPLTMKGSLQIHFSNNKAQVHCDIKARETQFLQFTSSLPIQVSHYPFLISVDKSAPFAAQIVAEGHLEEIFNFINTGHHHIEGWLSTSLNFSHTLNQPLLQGSLEIQDGTYENYYSGTYLKGIFGKGLAEKNTIVITELSAIDNARGKVSATGSVLLSPAQNFPFTLSTRLHELDAISFDTLSGKFSGDVTISGNQLAALAQGKVKVDEAVFKIPDHLPTALPELPITFINPPEIITRNRVTSPHSSPLQLDIDLTVPGRANVEGRGLNCQLKGKLHVTGTYIDIAAKGTLQLVNGEYVISGKVFELTQGELVFNDKPTPSAYMAVSGDCTLSDVNVTAMLRGPLSAPKLSFQSNPQLSTSSILSQILFNKDISEISAIQALQLAQTVISLSGNSGPDILEKIRKTLGIDRLTLVTSENDPSQVSLQIGKYLMSGVMLTLSQGAESRNVSVEVDLKKGLKLQAEVGEDQQGKFSLKWHHHY